MFKLCFVWICQFDIIQIRMENSELEYNENLPPAHELKLEHTQEVVITEKASRKLGSDGLTVRFDREGELLALGCKDGTKFLYNLAQQKLCAKADDLKDNAVTSLKWRPSGQTKSKILATADAGGQVTFYHVPTLKPLFSVQQTDNSINSLDFSWTGAHFATGGRDCHVRVYDQETKSISVDFLPAGWNSIGHDNRVFAVKFIDESILISGGWDSVVHVWDLRHGKSVQHFYGPNISAQSLDYSNGTILAGCYAAQNQLQFWDIKTLKKVQEIDWTAGNIDDAQYVYASGYSRRDPTIFGAASTGPHSELRIYHETIANPHKHDLIATLKGLSQGCFSLDFSSKTNQFAFTTPHHGLYVYDYHKAK